MAEPLEAEDPAQLEQYQRSVSQAKQEAKNGNLEGSIRLFRQALEICPSEKLMRNIKKLEETLASLAVEQEEDGFVDVCQSGLMLYGEMYDKLFDHQREGIAFLYSLYRDGRKGGILADDMGLGKTIQIIAFLSGMFDAELISSVLLIMPTTLVSNWTKEFANWTPGLRVKAFHRACRTERSRNLERVQRKNGVLLTTYQMLLNNWQQLSSFGGKEFVWDYVILDEAHKIKTPSAKTTKAVHAIPSKNRILLTGTPVQNNLKELWALFDFACQGSLLGTMKTFRMEYENPITRARAKDATPGEKALGFKISENLMSIIKPYFLRRSKDELQKKVKNNLSGDQRNDAAPAMPSLPRKNDFIVWLYLTPIQEEIYRKFLSLDHIKELLMTTRSPLAELNVLKKLCDHPRLLSARACSQLGLEISNYNDPDGGENEAVELLSMNRTTEHISDESLMEESGKLCFLMALLERLQEEGHRTLVFSQSRKMLDIIERLLTRRRFKLMRIDGTVTHLVEREKRISVFQTNRDYSIFLLTTQVGGIGITLTAATRVVIFDPSWNPATDSQAVDRAYRIGQKENVIIYRLITCGTVEEKIYRRQIFKDSLIRQSTGDNKNPYRYFTQQELRELFTLGDPRSSVTQRQLQSLHATQRKTDTKLDEHIAYIHSLDIFGISDHDLMYTQETVHDEAEDEGAHRYIEHRVQKAQELVQLESQLKDQAMANIRNTTEGAWLREMESSTLPKKKTPQSSLPHAPIPPVSIEPTNNDEVVNLVTDNVDSDECDVVNVSSRMTSLVIDVDDERILQNISNIDTLLFTNEERKPARIQEYGQKHELSTGSPFPQARSLSNKENFSPVSKVMSSDPPGEDVDDEEMVLNLSNVDTLLFTNEERKPARIQEYGQKHELSTGSPFPQARSLSNKENFSPVSKVMSSDPPGEDVDDEEMVLNISNVDTLLFTNEERKPARIQEYGQKHELSTGSPFSQARSLSNKENFSPVSKVMSSDPPGEDVDDEEMILNISNMDVSLSKNKECRPARMERYGQKHDLSTGSPFPQAHSLSNKNCSPESKVIIHHSPAEANSMFKDVQMSPLQQPFECVSDGNKQQTEMSLCVSTSSHREAHEINEVEAASPFQLQTSKMLECNTEQKSGMSEIILENECFSSSSPYQANFNLVLDESEDGLHEVSKKEMSVKDAENEGFQLRLDRDSSVAYSWLSENGINRSLQASKDIMGSMIVDGSNAACEILNDDSEIFFSYKRKTVKRIVSDDEEEEEDLLTGLDNSEHIKLSTSNNPDGICMSTPKSNGLLANPYFSPRIKVTGRKSTASRRSLVDMVLDQVEDMEEVVESASDMSLERSFHYSFERELSQESSDQELEVEEEPSGETLDSEDKSSYFHDAGPCQDDLSF